MGERVGCTGRSVESKVCLFDDDDLLVSVFMKNWMFASKYFTQNSKPVGPRHSSRLYATSLNASPKHSQKKYGSTIKSRTILSWLIHSEVVSKNEVIEYRSALDYDVKKRGLIGEAGVACLCCHKTVCISEFKRHAGCKSKDPCMNLVMKSGKPLVILQLEAWSTEYKARKVSIETSLIDEGDDLCGLCGLGGQLVCCDNCPAAFHEACLFEQIPEGNWYCRQCRCPICQDAVCDKDGSHSSGILKCLMCKNRYHETCTKGKYEKTGLISNWFCGERCQEVYKSLHSRIGLANHLSDGISWTLLKCIDGDDKAHASRNFIPLKAEANSKLAVAITLFQEYFCGMVDKKTKIDMIPQVMYSWGSPFPHLNFEGFYSVVLEKEDVAVSVASIRLHDVQVAELPYVATCTKYRQQGMCRRLINCVEELLKSLGIKKLLLPASDQHSLNMWIDSFGFQHLNEDESNNARKMNLMVLPGSTWLVKTL